MADTPPEPLPPRRSFAQQELSDRISRVEAGAAGAFVIGGLLLVVGLIVFLGGSSMFLFLVGPVLVLIGCIENLRAEVLKLRAKLDHD